MVAHLLFDSRSQKYRLGRCDRAQHLRRPSSAWEQAERDIGRERPPTPGPETGMVMNPTRRSRTRLSKSEVEAIRTARANGESVTSICRRFDIHRMTVWTHIKDLLRQPTYHSIEILDMLAYVVSSSYLTQLLPMGELSASSRSFADRQKSSFILIIRATISFRAVI